MKRSVRDQDGDLAVVRSHSGLRYISLRLWTSRFGGSTTCHGYTPAQARRLASNLLAGARKAEKRVRR